MIYHVLLINAKMGILSPEIFIIPAIEETQMLQLAAFHGFLYRFIFLHPWRDPWPSRVRQFALYLFPISIRRSTTWILCVLDVGLAGRVCFISTIPHLPPSTLIKLTYPILIAFFVGGSGATVSGLPRITSKFTYYIPYFSNSTTASYWIVVQETSYVFYDLLFLAWG